MNSLFTWMKCQIGRFILSEILSSDACSSIPSWEGVHVWFIGHSSSLGCYALIYFLFYVFFFSFLLTSTFSEVSFIPYILQFSTPTLSSSFVVNFWVQDLLCAYVSGDPDSTTVSTGTPSGMTFIIKTVASMLSLLSPVFTILLPISCVLHPCT